MTYRVSISEQTMERLREYATTIWGIGGTIGLPGHAGFTAEDVIVELLDAAENDIAETLKKEVF